MAKLAAYRAKRNFDRTAEPKGGDGSGPDGFAFVIQKHDASRLHYDLRLELDGVMKSWAVTKGPSLVPGEKRLAVHVEDHPVEYNDFEGTIPEGQYGGGTVLLWDRGHWVPQEDPRRGYAKGHLAFRLEGQKLSGGWHLVRMKKRPGERQEGWLLIKQEDEGARTPDEPDILEEEARSVASGRSLEEIASDPKGRVWQSNREEATEAGKAKAKPKRKTPAKSGRAPAKDKSANTEGEVAPSLDLAALTRDAPKRAIPKAIEPCLATLSAIVPTSDRWLHEIKWDGYRLIAFKTPRTVRLATRRGLDWTERFPGIAKAVQELPVDSAILDGEAVVEDERGAASFSALQNALSDEHGKIARDAIFYAFDLLYVEGHDLRPLPLGERKTRLATLVPTGTGGHLRLSEHLEADGAAMARSAQSVGLEGILSKRRDRPYRSGRTDDWLKIKFTERQEFVIAGYVPSTASAKAIGSLVLAYHETGKLRLAGRSGTGYTAQAARMLKGRLDELKRKTPPLSEKPNAEDKRGVVWVEPKLVAEIEFRGWTGDDRLRHAAFKGLREDKAAEEVVREQAKEDAVAGGGVKAAKPAQPGARKEAPGEIAGVTLTHPDRVLWPDAGITKQGLAEFYEEVADWVLPHVVDRPLSLIRCPAGISGSCFFQKHAWAGLSDHIERRTVKDEDGEEEILFVRDLSGLIALVQSSVLEIHPWGAKMADPERADRITMDLDPGDDVAWADVIAAAREVRERLSGLGLESFVKTTGGKGLHVVVPLSGPAPWPAVKAFAKSIADGMEADGPRRYIATASKKARRGLIYVDYLRNGRGATAIAAYSTRARAGATVSVPLAWDELDMSIKADHFTLDNLPARLAGLRSDPWGEMGKLRQKLPSGNARKARRS
jgi:bifunctional non-homologous end joining protein LigD